LNSELSDAMEKHMRKIVYEESRPFSYKDFLSFEVDGKWYTATEGTIRNKFSQFANEKKIELCYRSKIAFYTLLGVKFGKDKRLMTPNHKEDNNNNYNNTLVHHTSLINHPIYKILESTALEKRAIHNIHLKFKVSKLYELLLNATNLLLTKDPKNKALTITYYDIDTFTILITINKNDTVTVIVGCSENPVVLDFNGINRLSNALTRIEERLCNIIKSAAPLENNNSKLYDQIIVPSHKNWIITLWHIGRDSLSEYSKDMFHCRWDIAEQVTLRIYSKELTSGKKKIRIEVQQNPQLDIEKLQMNILKKIVE
jgi:hypothetical protein